MSLTASTVSTPEPTVLRAEDSPTSGRDLALRGPAAVLVLCLLALGAFVADGASGEADLGLAGVVLVTVALALTLSQAVRAGVGRPRRASRLAATAGTVASLFVAASLCAVGVLERLGPQVTSSDVFAAGVAVMSVVLLIVVPLSLGVFSWGVAQDRRLSGWVRALPSALVVVLALTAVTVAVTGGSGELWLQAAAVATTGALLTGLSAGLSRLVAGGGPAGAGGTCL